MLKQLHIVPDIALSSGGRALAPLRYAEALAKAGAYVTVYAESKDAGNLFRPASHSSGFQLINGRFTSSPLQSLIGKYKAINILCNQNSYDLIHLHGYWLPIFSVAAFVSLRRKIPFMVSPHGCLEPWALSHKRMKKLLALKSYQRIINRTAAMFFATSNQELIGLRRLGIYRPVASIPFGIDVGELTKRTPHEGKRCILFLSRIHPVKGLLDLVEAWAQVRRPNWRIVIAGPDEGDHKSKVEALIRLHGLTSDFEFVGLVDGKRKQACFAKADLFVLPSYSENFGLCVVEALASQLPVITTTATPWSNLVNFRCGWWVNPGVQGIAQALRSAMTTPHEELERMGKRGRQLVLEQYTWDKIGQDALQAYEWILGHRGKPSFVDVVHVDRQ